LELHDGPGFRAAGADRPAGDGDFVVTNRSAWTDVAGEQGYKIERKLASSATWPRLDDAC
jgi:hypothetical protein